MPFYGPRMRERLGGRASLGSLWRRGRALGSSLRDADALQRCLVAGLGLLVLQLIALLIFSAVEMGRFGATRDLAIYSQAAWMIGHGQLNPHSSLLGTAFWRNNAEFAVWPLAALYRLYPHPLLLKWLQDLAVVAAEAVVLLWARAALRAAPEGRVSARAGSVVLLGTAAVLVADPWVFQIAAFDFHLEAFTALGAVLAARDLWTGRTRRMWFWVLLVLLCGTSGALCLVGVGVAGALAGRKTRRAGVVLGALALGWLYGISAIGGDVVLAHGVAYSYLVGSHGAHTGIAAIGIGIVTHLPAVVHQFALKQRTLLEFVLAGGAVGILSPWGFGPAVSVLLPAILLPGTTFFRPAAAFQVWPAIIFVAVGTILVVVRLLTAVQHSEAHRRSARHLSLLVGGAWLLSSAVMAAQQIPGVVGQWTSIASGTAGELAAVKAEVPARAEVVADNAVVGLFADRSSVAMLNYGDMFTGATSRSRGGQTAAIPVLRKTVVFVVVPQQGVGIPPLLDSYETIAYAKHTLRARRLAARDGVYAFEWHPRSVGGTLHVP